MTAIMEDFIQGFIKGILFCAAVFVALIIFTILLSSLSS